jgi:hypothetical protein
MDGNRDERLRARAHQIWEQKGRPDGEDAEHWRQAEAELDQDGAPLANAERSVPEAEHVATGDGNPIAAQVEKAGRAGR